MLNPASNTITAQGSCFCKGCAQQRPHHATCGRDTMLCSQSPSKQPEVRSGIITQIHWKHQSYQSTLSPGCFPPYRKKEQKQRNGDAVLALHQALCSVLCFSWDRDGLSFSSLAGKSRGASGALQRTPILPSYFLQSAGAERRKSEPWVWEGAFPSKTQPKPCESILPPVLGLISPLSCTGGSAALLLHLGQGPYQNPWGSPHF